MTQQKRLSFRKNFQGDSLKNCFAEKEKQDQKKQYANKAK
jgi:hypothetical protein